MDSLTIEDADPEERPRQGRCMCRFGSALPEDTNYVSCAMSSARVPRWASRAGTG